ncbi:hypothetical protein CDL15_Pgr023822 [Punica granatum]|uniref:Uncharacterized protein n=1 Tax=Punica granatum TaxID=22663 RepID=A0A218W0A3_PUNGR|nr:hypothetical protein CDL15_Pgr023822 [Punica granatum]
MSDTVTSNNYTEHEHRFRLLLGSHTDSSNDFQVTEQAYISTKNHIQKLV